LNDGHKGWQRKLVQKTAGNFGGNGVKSFGIYRICGGATALSAQQMKFAT